MSTHHIDVNFTNSGVLANMVMRPSVLLLRLVSTTVLIAACAVATAQDVNVAAPGPSDAASSPSAGGESGPSLMNSLGSFFSRVKAAIPDAKPADPGSTQGFGQEHSENTQSTDKPHGLTNNSEKQGSIGVNIVDILNVSDKSNVVLDPQCRIMVQPFGITDNLATLAALAAKIKITDFFAQLENPKGNPLPKAGQRSTSDIVKLAARNLNWLPMQAELALGKSMLSDSEILDEDKNKDSRRVYAEARAVLADIIRDLPSPLPYDFQVKVLTKSYGNASALPGGIILVDRDLFKKGADQDFTYFVISHEVAHVLQRHQTQAYQAKLVDGIDSIDGLQKLMSAASGPNPGALLTYASSLKKLVVNFSEAQELQADSCAVRMLAKRIPNPAALAAKLRKIDHGLGSAVPIAKNSKGETLVDTLRNLGDGVMERHPTTNQRKANLLVAFAAITTPPIPSQVSDLTAAKK